MWQSMWSGYFLVTSVQEWQLGQWWDKKIFLIKALIMAALGHQVTAEYLQVCMLLFCILFIDFLLWTRIGRTSVTGPSVEISQKHYTECSIRSEAYCKKSLLFIYWNKVSHAHNQSFSGSSGCGKNCFHTLIVIIGSITWFLFHLSRCRAVPSNSPALQELSALPKHAPPWSCVECAGEECRWVESLNKKKSDNSKLGQKVLHPTTGPGVVWACIIVSNLSIVLQERPPKVLTPPPHTHGPGHHHFPATIHLQPAINSLHFRVQAINPGTLN